MRTLFFPLHAVSTRVPLMARPDLVPSSMYITIVRRMAALVRRQARHLRRLPSIQDILHLHMYQQRNHIILRQSRLRGGDYIYRQDSGGGTGVTPGRRSPYTPSHQQQQDATQQQQAHTQHYAPGALRPHASASEAMARPPSRSHATAALGTTHAQVQTPPRAGPAGAVPSYMYSTNSASPARPDARTTTPVRSSAANSPAYYDSQTSRSRGHAHHAHGQYTRTPSPLPPSQQQQQQQQYSHQKQRESARGNGAATPVRAHTPSRAPSVVPSAPKLSTPTPASRAGRDERRDLERSASRRQRREHRSSSRASNHGAPAPAPTTRHVRVGFWNRRGDHLTFEAKSSSSGGSSKAKPTSTVTGSNGGQGFVVFCPPGRCYPADLADYPEDGFKDHFGRAVNVRAGALPELPESVPLPGSRHAARGYDTVSVENSLEVVF